MSGGNLKPRSALLGAILFLCLGEAEYHRGTAIYTLGLGRRDQGGSQKEFVDTTTIRKLDAGVVRLGSRASSQRFRRTHPSMTEAALTVSRTGDLGSFTSLAEDATSPDTRLIPMSISRAGVDDLFSSSRHT
jgi:hypothetical protein